MSESRNILFVDDAEERHAAMQRAYPKGSVMYIYTATEAVNAMRDNSRFDQVHLDHDLEDDGSPAGYGEAKGDGTEIALWMANYLPVAKRPKMVRIHSWNIPAATRMQAILVDAGFANVVRLPFTKDLTWTDPACDSGGGVE